MSKIITSIGDARGLGCCILGLGRDAGMNGGTLDEMMGISGADDDSFYIDDPADTERGRVSDFDPVFTPETGPVAMSIPEPGPGGSLTVKGAGWSRGDGSYIVQRGDTLSGLARLYLGDAGRFREIWNLQNATYKSQRTPDNIVVGDLLVMPNEAVLRAKAMGVFVPKVPGSSSTAAPAPTPATSTPVATTTTTTKSAAATPPSHKVALGIGSALAAGVGLLLWRPPGSGHPAPRKRAKTRARRRR
jgi:LysM repeat protein